MTGLYTVLVLSVIICPLSFILIMAAVLVNYLRGSSHGLGELITAVIGAVLVVIGYKLQITPTPVVMASTVLSLHISHSISQYLFACGWLVTPSHLVL